MSKPDFTGAQWIKSSRSGGQNECVELAIMDGTIGVRDSKLADASPILTFTPVQVKAFLDSVKNNHFTKMI